MTSPVDVLILTNVVTCTRCRNHCLLKEHGGAMFSAATLFWDGCAAGRGELGEPSLTLAVCKPSWPKTVSSDSSSLFSLLLADSKNLLLQSSAKQKRSGVSHKTQVEGPSNSILSWFSQTQQDVNDSDACLSWEPCSSSWSYSE